MKAWNLTLSLSLSTNQSASELRLALMATPIHLYRILAQILPLAQQKLVRGHLAFSIVPWKEFNYADELNKSKACRGLQVH